MASESARSARADAAKTAEEVGVAAGQLSIRLQSFLDGVPILDPLAAHAHRVRDPMLRAIVECHRDLARQVAALAGAVEQLTTAV